MGHIPAIQAQRELIDKILNTGYLDDAGINEFEEIREKLRDLIKYIPKEKKNMRQTLQMNYCQQNGEKRN